MIQSRAGERWGKDLRAIRWESMKERLENTSWMAVTQNLKFGVVVNNYQSKQIDCLTDLTNMC